MTTAPSVDGLPAQRATLAAVPDLPADRMELLEALLHAVTDGFLFTINEVVIEVNDAFVAMTGFSRGELIGSGAPFPFWPREEEEQRAELARTMRAVGGGDKIEVEFVRKDGTRFPVSMNTRLVRGNDGEPLGFVTLLRDITEQRSEHNALVESRRMLDEAQAQARLGSWLLDYRQQGADVIGLPSAYSSELGRLHWSDEMYRIYGLQPGDPVTLNSGFDVMHPEDIRSCIAFFDRALRTGGRHVNDHRVVLPGEQIRHIRTIADVELDPLSGEPLVVRGSAQDITERVEVEQALAAREEALRLTVASSPVGLALVTIDGAMEQVNDSLCKVLGRTQDELVGVALYELAHPDEAGQNIAARLDMIEGRRESYACDRRYLHADGEYVWVSLHVGLVRSRDGSPLHFIVQMADITDKREHAALLKREARTDALTGLPNRRAWEENLLAALDIAREGGMPCHVGIIDLDHFKVYNDTFGHPAGDKLLAEAAQAWSAYLAAEVPLAFLARLGGEEFSVSIPGLSNDDAKTVMGEILRIVPRGQTASAGITRALPADEPGSAMTRADAALYAAKRAGRNQLQVLISG